MKHTSSDELTKLADQLADKVRALDALGVPFEIGQAGFALAGMLYNAARHPEVSAAPIVQMIGDADRMLAMADAAVKRLSR